MGKIKISVILPNYNGEKHISRAIDSFLKQEHEYKELVIVDGKSSDKSHEIIEGYLASNENIKWIKEKDTNVTDAINIGLKYCTGDFISFLASDVFYYDGTIFSTIIKNYLMVPFDIIYFDYYFYNKRDNKVHLMKCPNVEFNKNNLLKYGTIAGFDNIFISNRIYNKHRYNPLYNLCSDWELFLRITQEPLLSLYVEKICTINVQDGFNLSQKYATEQMNQIQQVGKLYNSDNVKLYFESENKLPPPIKTEVKNLIRRILRRLFK